MTDELESTLEQAEAQGQPTPAVPSPVSGVKPPSAPSVDVESLLDARLAAFEERLLETLDRKSQSVKDRRIAGLLDDVGELKSYLQKSGGDVDKAVREMQIDSLIKGERSPANVPGRTAADDTQNAYVGVSTELLNGAGIAFNDPDYEAFVKRWEGRVMNPEHWRTLTKAYIDGRQNKEAKQEGVTQAAAAGTSGAPLTSPNVGADMASITAKLNEYYSGKHGSITDPRNELEIQQLEAKLNEIEPMLNLNDPNVHVDLRGTEPWSVR